MPVAAREMVYDLTADPKEKKDLLPKQPDLRTGLRAALGAALDRDVVVAYRVSNRFARRVPT